MLGGMGVVYRGRDTRLDRAVAIKVLPAAFAADAERLTRFRREARALGALNHPHIAQVYAFEETEGTCAIVMELVDGEQLSGAIARGPMPLHDVVRIAEHIIAGLDAAHEQGIVHRDLKPANIKVRQDGSAKILDFGLAKSVAPSLEAIASEETESHLTEAGSVLGTKPYMSPEQIRGEPVDKRTDIWAFGCVAFEMVAGRRAFDGKTTTDIIGAIVRGEPDWSALPPTCPAAIRRLLRHCLQKDARERLRDIADARADLREAIIGTPTATTRSGRRMDYR